MACYYCGAEKVYAKGLCVACYHRSRRNGTPERKTAKTRKRNPPSDKVKAILADYNKTMNQAETAKRFHLSHQYVNYIVNRYGGSEYRQYSTDVLDALKEKFPKFSKVALCMVRNPQYGVDLSKDAKRFLKSLEDSKK